MSLKLVAILMLIVTTVTVGCGCAIRFGGDAFKGAASGHLALGILTLLLAVVTCLKALAR